MSLTRWLVNVIKNIIIDVVDIQDSNESWDIQDFKFMGILLLKL